MRTTNGIQIEITISRERFFFLASFWTRINLSQKDFKSEDLLYLLFPFELFLMGSFSFALHAMKQPGNNIYE